MFIEHAFFHTPNVVVLDEKLKKLTNFIDDTTLLIKVFLLYLDMLFMPYNIFRAIFPHTPQRNYMQIMDIPFTYQGVYINI